MKTCAITDGTAQQRPDWLLRRCAELASGGIDLLLLRERELSPEALALFTREVVRAAGHTPVIVAGPPALALAAGAAGVHLSARPSELSEAQVRDVFPHAYITQSCHSIHDVRQARANAILFGPVFGKWVDGIEVVPGLGLPRLAEAVTAAAGIPVYALGGITKANATQCTSQGIAAIRLFFT